MHLVVGDVHGKPDELEDCENLLQGVGDTMVKHRIEHCWFLGDQFNTHSLVHLDVLNMWMKWIERLTKICRVYLLVGNHDMAPSGSHAMEIFEGWDSVTVIDRPAILQSVNAFVCPYLSKDGFIEALTATSRVPKTVICHQTFEGAQFENGFYSPDGVKLSSLPAQVTNIISGHIHEPQYLNAGDQSVTYVGSPRWLTLSDANSNRSIMVFDDSWKEVMSIPTHQWCKKIWRIQVTPDSTPFEETDSRHEYVFDLKGPKTWCDEQSVKYSKMGKVRVFPEVVKTFSVKESDGILKAFRKYIDTYEPKKVEKEKFREYAIRQFGQL